MSHSHSPQESPLKEAYQESGNSLAEVQYAYPNNLPTTQDQNFSLSETNHVPEHQQGEPVVAYPDLDYQHEINSITNTTITTTTLEVPPEGYPPENPASPEVEPPSAKTTNLGNHQTTNNSSLQQPSVKIDDSQEYQPKPHDPSFRPSSNQYPNEQVASIQASPQQNRREDTHLLPGKSRSNTKKEKTPKGDETHKDPPEKFNPTLPQEEQFSQQANDQGKQKPVSEETDQNLDQKENSHSQTQRVPLPKPDGYPPDRPPTSPSKLEPPKDPPSKCCCECCDFCSSCSIL
ncbi:hypothetical protein CCACVL1_19473 [Corchorus capsularis]|uniref:Uncharacterized protein n=1 Tax=Corchorus capsularis TaxID=210143 RepID=A0A1R3HGP3_COCAP|nr:hypothetical protein CCACVL1_19473 [Corchorus capsularis]